MKNEIKLPTTLQQAILYFADADRALAYMVAKRWPDGVVCPTCGAKDAHYLTNQRRWKCRKMHPKRQFSIKTGTVMEDSPLGLDKWMVATWMLVNAKNGISSYEVHRALGITQKSAWFLTHRIRLAMQYGSFEKKLTGTVEGDEAYIGGITRNMHEEKKPVWANDKTIVQGLLQRTTENKPSQVRATVIEKARRPHIQDTVRANVEPGSFVMTDALGSYKGLEADYIHMAINHAKSYAEGRIHTNGLENFWSLLRRTLEGTYVACEPFHLEAYLDEQCFRFNNRKMNDGERMLAVSAMFGGKRLTYAALTGKIAGAPSETLS